MESSAISSIAELTDAYIYGAITIVFGVVVALADL